MAPNSCFCLKSPHQSKETRASVVVPVTKESEGAVVQVRSSGEEETGFFTIGGSDESFRSWGWRVLVLFLSAVASHQVVETGNPCPRFAVVSSGGGLTTMVPLLSSVAVDFPEGFCFHFLSHLSNSETAVPFFSQASALAAQ